MKNSGFAIGLTIAAPILAFLWLWDTDWYVSDIVIWLSLFVVGGLAAARKTSRGES